MRAKIKFPHRKKLVEREVRENLFGIPYIISRGNSVELTLQPDGSYAVAVDYVQLYAGVK